MKRNFSGEFGEYRVEGQLFGARQGLKIQAKLAKILGPSLGTMSQVGVNPDAIGLGIEKLVSHLDGDEIVNIVLQLLSRVTIIAPDERVDFSGHDAAKVFDDFFAGNLELLVDVIELVVMSNFAPLLKKLGALLNDSERSLTGDER